MHFSYEIVVRIFAIHVRIQILETYVFKVKVCSGVMLMHYRTAELQVRSWCTHITIANKMHDACTVLFRHIASFFIAIVPSRSLILHVIPFPLHRNVTHAIQFLFACFLQLQTKHSHYTASVYSFRLHLSFSIYTFNIPHAYV